MLPFISDLIQVLHPGKRTIARDSLQRERHLLSEYRSLYALKSVVCIVPKLAPLDGSSLNSVLSDSRIHDEWSQDFEELKKLNIPKFSEGVNPGDQRAVYQLIRAFKPRTILEIGTHIGCSTANIALAAKRSLAGKDVDDVRLTTVDVVDMNNEQTRPWEKYGATRSPKASLEQVGFASHTEFVVGPSLKFLENSANHGRFDFIFLDGDHSAKTVYQEIPAALQCLASGGRLLLHDYYPDAKPLWSDGNFIPGVFLAVQRLLNEGGKFTVLPLGQLPWPTKMGSSMTSLAMIGPSD